MAEPILTAGGRAVEHRSEVFVGIDVAKARNTIAVADGERGEMRFVGEVDAAEESVRRVVKRIAATCEWAHLGTRPAPRDTDSIGSSPRLVTPAPWWRRH